MKVPLSVIERVVMIACKSFAYLLGLTLLTKRFIVSTGLLKDFGWMTTNIYLGFPFGIISILLHFYMLLFDPRKAYRFYDFALLLWVTGNFIWMTTEFVSTNPSSHIHVGPHTPIGGLSDQTVKDMVAAKSVLFLVSTISQVVMYILIYCRTIPMPEDEEEDTILRNEATLFFFGSRSYTKQTDHSALDSMDDITIMGDQPPSYGFTLAFIENFYIIFWVSKDLFWAWGTGDWAEGRDFAIAFESIAICCGTLSICIYILVSYLYRRNVLRLLDSITTILWIMANFVWMCGEFFIRYDNLRYDDHTEGNDSDTRIISATLFLLGLSVQSYILLKVIWHIVRGNNNSNNSINRRSKNPSHHQIEMMQVDSPLKFRNIMISFAPQNESKNSNNGHSGKQLFDEEDESTILF